MGIPEYQLETWSHQGSIIQSSHTYNTIKNVLENPRTPYVGKNYQVFLQGSYGNDTNILAESDVDVVIKLNDCWLSDLESLTNDAKAAYKHSFVDSYDHVKFKQDVLQVLTDRYGADVDAGDKAIAIIANGSRRKVDVIVAVQFRRYFQFKSISDQSYTEGICFWNKAGKLITNYPKQHSANLTARHKASGTWLKPMIRVLKNVRTRLIDNGLIKSDLAPSYYLEGLLYNVPSDKFARSYQECFFNALSWIQSEANKNDLVCANEQYYLLRDGYHTCWPTAAADAFLQAAVRLWNEW